MDQTPTSNKGLFITLFISVAVAICVLGLWYGMSHHLIGSASPVSSTLSGTIYIATPAWQIASSSIQGIIKYPLDGKASHINRFSLASIDTGVSALAVSLSPDKNWVAMPSLSASKGSLVVKSLSGSGKETVIDSGATKIFVSRPIWSSTASQIAYAVLSVTTLPSISGTRGATVSKSSPASKTASAPTAPKLEAFVASANGSGSPKLIGTGVPVGFSPDARSIVLATGSHLSVVGATTSPQLVGAELDDTSTVSFSLDGQFMVITHPDRFTVFHMDWLHNLIGFYAEVHVVSSNAQFNAKNQLMVIDVNHVVHTYSLTGKFAEIGRKTLDLPATFGLLAWL